MHHRVTPPTMVRNHVPAYRAWQIQFKRFKQRGEFGLLFLKQSAHVLPVFLRLVNNGHWPSSLARHFTRRSGGRRHEVSGRRGDGPPFGTSFPASSYNTTPLRSRLHPCS
jgi:hypothetical protein